MTAAYRARVAFATKRLKAFLKVLILNKRGFLGLGVLIFFIALALAAPLLTQNDPTYGYYVTSDYAMPIWFKYFQSENIAEDIKPITTPGFTATSVYQEWNLTSTPTPKANVTLHYASDEGNPASLGGSGPGSASITFRRTTLLIPAGTISASLTNEFYYPYKVSPKRFTAGIAMLARGAEDVSVDIRLFIANTTGYKLYVWVPPSIESTTPSWIVSPKIDSYEAALKERIEKITGQTGADPAKVLFPTPSSYVYGVEIIFKDTKSLPIDREITVYIDDFTIRLYGNAYGLFGTDYNGRDIFSQLIYGARISLFVGLLSAILSVVVGLFVGLVAGYVGGAADEIIMRLTDGLLVLPGLPLLLVLIAVLGPSIWNLIMVIGVLGWMGFARTVRSQTLSLKERPFVEAAKAIGASKWHIILRHILPNVMSLVYVSLALSVPGAILSEAALSFLGLFDPSVISWGRMLHDVQEFQGFEKWWWVVPPGISIALVSLSFILLGYALDETLNPRLRQRR